MKTSDFSVVIIGSGAAGLYAALKISSRSDFEGKILLVTKSPLGESNSRYAQGGVAGVIGSNSIDSVSLHVKDTTNAGAGLCDIKTVEFISKNSERVLKDLVSNGVKFDLNENGDFEYTLGGGHSVKRVIHSGEDLTGMGIINALVKDVKNSDKIQIAEKTMAVELLVTKDNVCIGAILFNKKTEEYEVIYTPNLILATGGVGQVYEYTTNPYGATGDGIALAYEAGAEIQDIEFIQFHPTALVLSSENKNRYLISEAMRGEGARLVNKNGEEFMSEYSDSKELAPRDVVTRAILSEMKKEQNPNVFLDASSIDSEKLLHRFPSIAKKCKTNGIDITKEPIPVAPAAHYTIGGVKAQINGETSIRGLYVIGEAASTGFHGANRLASNSLLECVVCANELAKDLTFENNVKTDEKVKNLINCYSEDVETKPFDCRLNKNKLKKIMWEKVGIIRDERTLAEAKEELKNMFNEFGSSRKRSSFEEYEYRNMLTTACLITECAIARKESRGAHYRSDYPKTNDSCKHSVIDKTLLNYFRV